MKFEESIIDVLKQEGWAPESNQAYNVRGVQDKIKQGTDRVIIPAEVPNAEMNELLEGSSDASKLIRKCMDTPGGIIFLSMMSNWNDNDPELITLVSLAKKTNRPEFLIVFRELLQNLRVSFWEVHRARKVLEAWHIRKLSGYVAEFWKKTKEKKQDIIRDSFKNLVELICASRQPMFLDPKNQLQIINLSTIWSLNEINWKLGDFLVQDSQYSLWERVDRFLHEARPGTIWLSGKERLEKNIQTGLEAGAQFAQWCLSAALAKTKNKKTAAQLFLDSAGKILSTPGIYWLDFIATAPSLLKDTSCLSAIIQIMKDKEYTRIAWELDNARKRHKQDFDASTQSSNDVERLIKRLIFENRYTYNPELFEIHNWVLRVCPWFIDFVRLVVVREQEASHIRVVEKWCPMMHVKTRNSGQENIVLMEDFARLYGETVQAIWSKF